MLSLRGRLFVWILRHRHLLRFKLRPETERDWATDLAGVRRAAEASAGMLGRLPRDVSADPLDAGGLPSEWIRPATARADAGAVLYFHGGGYVLGSVAAHRAIVAKFVRGGAVPALAFDYRLAPEHPFPAALDDALTAYDWLLAQGFPPGRVVFAGDSAGGGLLLAAMLALKDRGSPLPGAGVALSPWTDLTFSGAILPGQRPPLPGPHGLLAGLPDPLPRGARSPGPVRLPPARGPGRPAPAAPLRGQGRDPCATTPWLSRTRPGPPGFRPPCAWARASSTATRPAPRSSPRPRPPWRKSGPSSPGSRVEEGESGRAAGLSASGGQGGAPPWNPFHGEVRALGGNAAQGPHLPVNGSPEGGSPLAPGGAQTGRKPPYQAAGTIGKQLTFSG